MIGTSQVWTRVIACAERVAATDATVLIQGETGTGKELLARTIHQRSARAGAPFIRVDCGALPASLFEAELYGHARGAFTGALARRAGRIEAASGGTLFLDEIGELPLESQPKLLRVLQEREFEAVGSERTQRADIRVVAATNVDLKSAIRRGSFRADLYYRLAAFCLDVPPLRARAQDIPALALHFVRQQAQLLNKPLRSIDQQAIAALCEHPWPGNVRELRNAIERASILAEGFSVTLEDLALESAAPAAADLAPEPQVAPRRIPALRDVERRHIEQVLQACAGVIEGRRGAAAALGLPASTLRFRARKLGIPIGRQAARELTAPADSALHAYFAVHDPAMS